jgi:hypothetical protein
VALKVNVGNSVDSVDLLDRGDSGNSINLGDLRESGDLGDLTESGDSGDSGDRGEKSRRISGSEIVRVRPGILTVGPGIFWDDAVDAIMTIREDALRVIGFRTDGSCESKEAL